MNRILSLKYHNGKIDDKQLVILRHLHFWRDNW